MVTRSICAVKQSIDSRQPCSSLHTQLMYALLKMLGFSQIDVVLDCHEGSSSVIGQSAVVSPTNFLQALSRPDAFGLRIYNILYHFLIHHGSENQTCTLRQAPCALL